MNRSRGPASIACKERSSRNSLRHGLTGQINVSLKPETPMERQLALAIAEDNRAIDRDNRLKQAREAACAPRKPKPLAARAA